MKIGILEPLDFSPKAIELLSGVGDVSLYREGSVRDFISNKQVLFVRLAHQLSAELLTAAKDLKYLCSPTTGFNHLDTAYCRSRQIEIISLKGETRFLNTIRATPEHTLGLILALLRNYRQAFLSEHNNQWDRDKYKGEEVYGKKIGIIGMGRVGKLVSGYLRNMGASVGFYDIRQVKRNRFEKCFNDAEALLEWADIAVLTASFIPENGYILSAREINLLKGKYLINTARAELTDEAYLIEKITQNYFKGIALDVIQKEQEDRNNLNALLRAAEGKNAIITPHIGGATFSSMGRTEEFIAEKLLGMHLKRR